jgi:uncharacterized protein involved in exopolysaccharide biosynthesis
MVMDESAAPAGTESAARTSRVGAVVGRLPRILLTTTALVGVTWIGLQFMPRVYEATTVLEVADGQVRSEHSQQLLGATLLSGVIDDLGLAGDRDFAAGAGDTPDARALDRLRQAVTVDAQGAHRLAIAVRLDDPDLAAMIANTVAEQHVMTAPMITVEAAPAVMEPVVEPVVESVAADQPAMPDPATLRQIDAAQEREGVARARAELIRSLIAAGQHVDSVPEIQSSASYSRLAEQRADLDAELVERSTTLLANHPVMQNLTAQIGELDARLRTEGERIAGSLEAEAAMQAQLVARLETLVEPSAQPATADTPVLRGAVGATPVEASVETLEAVTAETVIPSVVVTSIASAPSEPVLPRQNLILALVAMGSVVGQVALVLAGQGRRTRQREEPLFDQDAADESVIADGDEAIAAEASESIQPVVMSEPLAELVLIEADTPVPMEATVVELDEPVVEDTTVAEDTTVPDVIAAAGPILPAVPGSRLVDLLGDLASGETRTLLIASHGDDSGALSLANLLSEALTELGKSVVVIDAGSRKTGQHLGISDLSLGLAGFGDVVATPLPGAVTTVPWGRCQLLDKKSDKPATLVRALADLHDVVLVSTGRLGSKSSLSAFAGAAGRVVIMSDEHDTNPHMAEFCTEITGAGYGEASVMAPLSRAA